MNSTEKLIGLLGLKLSDSEIDEFMKIDVVLDSKPMSLPGYDYFWGRRCKHHHWERRERSGRIYRLRDDVKDALENTLETGDISAHWNKAYRITEALANEEQSLLMSRLNYHVTQIKVLLCLLQLAMPLGVMIPAVLGDPIPVVIMMVICYACKEIADLVDKVPSCFESYQSDLVKKDFSNAAQSAGIVLNTTVETTLTDFMPPTQFSNADKLEAAVENDRSLSDAIKELPQHFYCPITHAIMTVPVYTYDNPTRFELSAITDWVRTGGTHPVTRKRLYRHQLFTDYELKNEIEAAVNNILGKPMPANEKTPLSSNDKTSYQAIVQEDYLEGRYQNTPA